MWVRGLKLQSLLVLISLVVSHPMWVRGLKHSILCLTACVYVVASYVGAWIETLEYLRPLTRISSRILCGCVD